MSLSHHKASVGVKVHLSFIPCILMVTHFSANEYVGVVVFYAHGKVLNCIPDATKVDYHSFYRLSFSTNRCFLGVFLGCICFTFT